MRSEFEGKYYSRPQPKLSPPLPEELRPTDHDVRFVGRRSRVGDGNKLHRDQVSKAATADESSTPDSGSVDGSPRWDHRSRGRQREACADRLAEIPRRTARVGSPIELAMKTSDSEWHRRTTLRARRATRREPIALIGCVPSTRTKRFALIWSEPTKTSPKKSRRTSASDIGPLFGHSAESRGTRAYQFRFRTCLKRQQNDSPTSKTTPPPEPLSGRMRPPSSPVRRDSPTARSTSRAIAWHTCSVNWAAAVGIAFAVSQKSPAAITAMHGIMKADCCYVPIDLSSPVLRAGRIVQSCRPKVCLADKSGVKLLKNEIQRTPPNGSQPIVGTMQQEQIVADHFRTEFDASDLERMDAGSGQPKQSVRCRPYPVYVRFHRHPQGRGDLA